MALSIAGLTVKLCLMRKAAGEIAQGFAEKLSTDTNTLIDISTRDRAMRALASAVNRELRRLRELRRRYQQGDLELKAAVANISHDLRTPLTAICGYLELLDQEEKSPRAEEYLSVIQDRAQLLRQLTEELFRYCVVLSDPELEGEPLAEKPVSIAIQAVAFFAVLRARGIEPQVTMPETRVERRLDRAALSRVFSNLLSNAVKYSDGDLTVELTPQGEVIFSNACRGLTEVDAAKLFDRFYTVEAARKSTGLGLSIARSLTERMGGALTARYQKDRLTLTASFPQQGRP